MAKPGKGSSKKLTKRTDIQLKKNESIKREGKQILVAATSGMWSDDDSTLDAEKEESVISEKVCQEESDTEVVSIATRDNLMSSDSDEDELQPSHDGNDSKEEESDDLGLGSDESSDDEDEALEKKSQQQEVIALPTAEQLQIEEAEGADLAIVRRRINDIVGTLSDFKRRRDINLTRREYIQALKRDLSVYFGYLPELVQLLLDLFSPAEALEFFESNEEERPVVLRTNTLKTRRRDLAQALIARATPEYLSGQYMLQSPSSFLPVMSLGPLPGEKCLDMASAPGGKTTHMAQLMNNTGLLFANELRKERVPALVANCARLGVQNVVTTCHVCFMFFSISN
eukprot:GSMAST32.ASY1.ANO1.361.1 assembled CDS